MKVLHVYKDYYPVVGGIENLVKHIASGLAGYPEMKVRVLATERGRHTTRAIVDGIEVTKVGRIATIGSAPIAPELVSEMGRRTYDIVHLHFPYPIADLAYLLNGHSRRLVITYHSDIVRQRLLLAIYRPFLGQILRRADVITVASERYVRTSPFLRPHAKKTLVLPFGIDVDRFTPSIAIEKRADEIRRALDVPLTLFVGELRYYKGVDVLIRAMRTAPGRLAIVGLGPEEDRLRALVNAEGLADRVSFRGRVPDDELLAHYHAADVFVLPSTLRAEAWGMVLLEAMACGQPLVTTEIGTGTSVINVDGETGIVVPPNNPAALATAIRSIVEDPDRRQAMSYAARRRVVREYTEQRMLDGFYDLYQRLMR